MEISYYPGCTLKTSAKNYENTGLAILPIFDINPIEIKDWVCCGATYSLTSDNLMYQLAPIRTLIRAKESGNPRLLTLCDMCYNTLKRAGLFIKNDAEKREKIRNFMDEEETEYEGDEIEVIHLLTLLNEVGPQNIAKKMVKSPGDLKIATYYGCMLLRPKEIQADSSENPQLMENIFKALGVEIVDYPFRTECCGSYQIVNRREIILDRTKKIISSAVKNGADLMVLSCPLCDYNLEATQQELMENDSNFKPLPVLYFPQLLALMLGIDPELNDWSLHNIDPTSVLKRKGIL